MLHGKPNTLVTLNWSITVIVFLNSQVTLSSSTSLDRIALERLLAGGSLLQVNPQRRFISQRSESPGYLLREKLHFHQIEELGLLEAPLLDIQCLEELIERLPHLRLVSNFILFLFSSTAVHWSWLIGYNSFLFHSSQLLVKGWPIRGLVNNYKRTRSTEEKVTSGEL